MTKPARPCFLTQPLLGMLAAALLAAPTSAATTTVDFDSFASGTLVTTQLLVSDGVSFGPDGVEAQSNAGARSAPNVGATCSACLGEFQNPPFVAEFSALQQEVSLYAEGDEDGAAGSQQSITLKAFNDADSEIFSQSVTFNQGSGWRLLTVGNTAGSAQIRRIELTGGRTAFPTPTNFIMADDLSFTSNQAPPPPIDTTWPVVVVLQPEVDAVVNEPHVLVEATASDNVAVATMTGTVFHRSTNTTVATLDFCGSASSGSCSNPVTRSQDVSLVPAIEGEHVFRAVACDPSNNCTLATRIFTYEELAPPPEVEVFTSVVEINQGVQTGFFSIGLPGTDKSATPAARLVAGRNTVVRFYPLAVGDTRTGYSPRLTGRITYEDDSVASVFSSPNAGQSAVTVEPDPGASGRADEYVRMRIQASRTLNYVIPGERLVNAKWLEVRLADGGPITGWLKVPIAPAVRLAVKTVFLYGSAIPAGDGPTPEIDIVNGFDYLKAAYPVSEVMHIVTPPKQMYEHDFCAAFVGIASDAPGLACALWTLNLASVHGHVPLNGDPTHVVVVGQVPQGSFARVGMAIDQTAIAMPLNDAAYAHEIGHTAGRPHVGPSIGWDLFQGNIGPHEEAGVEDWSHPHGLMGSTNFGVVVVNTVPPPNVDSLGEWDLTVIDPCPVLNQALREPDCETPNEGTGTHDFMSYGHGNAGLGPLNQTSHSRSWISALNWNRIYDNIAENGQVSASSATTTAVDGLLIDAVLLADGTMAALPIMRRSVAPEELAAQSSDGPYEMSLYDDQGAEILSQRFDVAFLHDEAQQIFLLDRTVPLQENLARVVVRKDDAVILDRSGSPNKPEVELLYPTGGQVLETGVHTVSWEVADADGDIVISHLEYSSDGGLTWTTLGLTEGKGSAEQDVEIDDLSASDLGMFRVTVSDGFHTAEARSTCPIAVGVAAAANCSAGTCVSSETRLCLGSGRFQVDVDWARPDSSSGEGQAFQLTEDTGYFWFFNQDNVEAVVKVLDGCGVNDRFWVFAGGLTNVAVSMTVTDTATGESQVYGNQQGNPFQPIQDTGAFATCSEGSSSGLVRLGLAGSGTELLLADGRFRVTAEWMDGDGSTGSAQGVQLTEDTGYFWFFNQNNVETVVKVLDACGTNDRFWVFAGGLTDVAVTMTVTDMETGKSKAYQNAQGTPFQPIQDTGAFSTCSK